MSNGNLRPEKRMDKNGRLVTKHVRAGDISKEVSLPSVKQPSVSRHLQAPLLIEQIALGKSAREKLGVGIIDFTLDDLDPEAVESLEELLRADEEMRPTSYVTQSAISNAMGSDTLEQCVTTMHNITVFGEVFAVPDNPGMVSYVKGIGQYSTDVANLEVDYLLDAEPEEAASIAALLKFTMEAHQSLDEVAVYDSFFDTFDSSSGVTESYVKLKDDDLAAYIVEHPDRADEILGMIKDAGHLLPVELVDARFNHEVQSIRDGVL